jgi:hypothetical protein
MVAKITQARPTVRTALYYNENKVQQGIASVIGVNNIVTDFINPADIPISDKLHTFNQYLKSNKRVKNVSFHVSLNPKISEAGTISDEKYNEIAANYMSEMGYADQPYIVYKHSDIDREHIHIVSLRVDFLGNKISDKFEKAKSWSTVKKITDTFNLEIIDSQKLNFRERIVKEKEQNISEFKQLYLQKPDRLRDKDADKLNKLRAILNYVDQYNYSSFAQYKMILNQFNIDCGMIKGEYEGLNYYIGSSIEPNFMERGFSASKIRKGFSYPKLEQQTKENSYTNSKDKYSPKQISNQIKYFLKQYKSINLIELKSSLEKEGINLYINHNSAGRIYGCTVIDQSRNKIYKGSEVGLSATFLDSLKMNVVIKNETYYTLRKDLNTAYNKLKKETTFYESDFIPGLLSYKNDLLKEIQKKYLSKKIDATLFNEIFESFNEYKNDQLESIKEKENSYALNQAYIFINFAKHLPLEQSKEFLDKCGLNIYLGTDEIPYLKIEKKRGAVNVPIPDSYVPTMLKQSYIPQNSYSFNKTEIAIIKNWYNLDKLNFQIISKTQLLRFLPEEYQVKLLRAMKDSVVNTAFLSHFNTVEELFKAGMILTKEKNNYYFEYYDQKNIRTQLTEEQINLFSTKLLNSQIKWQSSILKSDAYPLYVQLEQAKKLKNPDLFEKTIDSLFYIDKLKYVALKKTIGKESSLDNKISLAQQYIEKHVFNKKRSL